MSSHVDLVGVLFVLWGLLTTLAGLSTLALGLGALALITSGAPRGGGQFAAGVTAAAFTALALIAILWGIAHVVVGVPLRRRRHWSRVAALVLGSVDLVLLPYGTALGCYSLWVLLSEGGKKVFEIAD
jgi:peptidoglycan/LPS O-acetylase OafA/YrhL